MTINIQLTPEVEAELAAQAAAEGMDVPSYAANLLQKAASARKTQSAKRSFFAFLRESPLAGVELSLERNRDGGRDVEL